MNPERTLDFPPVWQVHHEKALIAQSLQTRSTGAAEVDKAALHIGAVAFIHRFGSSLNGHVHFHVCAADGVFEQVALCDWTTLEQPLVVDRLQPTRVIHDVKSFDWFRPRPV